MATHIAIIGVDGCGKSTCSLGTLEALAATSHVAGVGDGLLTGDGSGRLRELTGVPGAGLKRALGRAAKRSRGKTLYQLTKFAELMCRANIVNAIERDRDPEYIVTDGSPLLNAAAWGFYYHPKHFEPDEYMRSIGYLCHDNPVPPARMLFYLRHIPGVFLAGGLRLARFRRPDVTFFLNVSPAVAVRRIVSRGEERQIHERKGFLERLQGAYGMVCDLLENDFGCEVHRFPVDESTPEETVAKIVERIRRRESRSGESRA
jgi:hypothetical protein